METRATQEVRIYVLVLNTFGAAEEGEIVATVVKNRREGEQNE